MGSPMLVLALVVCTLCPVTGLTDNKILENMLQKLYENNPTYNIDQAVSALVVNKTHVLFEGYAGLAQFQGNVPNSASTRFIINSISKIITSVTALRAFQDYLQPKGITLSDNILTTMPFAVNTPFPTASIDQFLHHTTGIVDNWDVLDGLYTFGHDSPITLEELARGYLTSNGSLYSEKNFEYQDVFAYSNVAFGILGYLVECWTGQSFVEYSTKTILEPLGISATGTNKGGGWKLSSINGAPTALPNGVEQLFGYPDISAGLFVGSGRALAQFLQACVNDFYTPDGQRLLSAELVKHLKDLDSLTIATGSTVGFSIQSVWYFGDRVLLGHDGGDIGLSGAFYWEDIDCPFGALILTNYEWPSSIDDPGLPNLMIRRLMNRFQPWDTPTPECAFGKPWEIQQHTLRTQRKAGHHTKRHQKRRSREDDYEWDLWMREDGMSVNP